jgi:hypothetical protein
MSKFSVCVGEIVISGTAWPAINVQEGERGIVVEIYEHGGGDWGAQILFQNGGDCGFSKEEIDDFIIKTNLVVPELTTYKFTSVINLHRDWMMNKFNRAWDNEHTQKDC